MFLIISASILLFSCTTTKNIAYFDDLTDTSKIYNQTINGAYEVQIQADDLLEIIINDVNSQAAAPFNLGNLTPASVPGSQVLQSTTGIRLNPVTESGETSKGYLVDKDGGIDFPVLGNIQVKGLTVRQLKEFIKIQAK